MTELRIQGALESPRPIREGEASCRERVEATLAPADESPAGRLTPLDPR
jgi:hypothetical protein